MAHPAHFVAFIFLAIAALILLSISLKIGLRGQRTLFNMSLLLGTGSFVHSLYHLAEYLSLVILADLILLPISASLFAVFALYYLKSGRERKMELEAIAIGN